MSDNIQEHDLKDELIAERKVGYFDKPTDMANWFYKTIINIDIFFKLNFQSHLN